MNSNSCDICSTSYQSLDYCDPWELLKRWDTCGSCPKENELRAAARQVWSRKPQWWVVNGKTMVPIWLVERLKNRARGAVVTPIPS